MNNTLNYLTFSLLLSLTVLLPFAGKAQCSIDNLIAEASQCDTNLLFYMDISLEVENPDSDSFYVELEGQLFGPFSYADVPVSVGPFYGDGDNSWITVFDMNNHACSAITMIEKPDCPWEKCGFENLEVIEITCLPDENIMSVCINFEPLGYDISKVWVFYFNEYLGEFDANQLPVCNILLPYNEEISLGELTIFTDDYSSCSQTIEFEIPDCDGGDCKITGLFAEAYPCDTNMMFYFDVTLEVENPASDSFFVEMEGQVFGPFAYTDVPVKVGPFNGNGEDTWIYVEDIIDPGCFDQINVLKPNCPQEECAIENLKITSLECIPSLNAVAVCIDFDIIGTTVDEISAFYGAVHLGDYKIDELPFCNILIPYDIGISEGTFSICAGDYQACCDDIIFAMPDCNSDCFISDFIVENYDCDSMGNFYVDLDFNVHNTMTDSFNIYIKNSEGAVFYEGSHSYSELPLIHLGPFAGTGEDFIYSVTAIGYESCYYQTTHASPSCTECVIKDLFAEAYPCDTNMMFYFDVTLEVENPASDSFFVEMEGQVFGPFAYTDVPVKVGPFNGNGEDTWIYVEDIIDPGCFDQINVLKPNCPQEECAIENLKITSLECIPSLNAVAVCIDFDIIGTTVDEISAFYGAVHLGDYKIDELPFCNILIPYDIGISEGTFSICAGDYQSCCDDVIFAMPDCNSDCFISDFIIENHDCDSMGNFYVDIDFKVHNTMTDSFDIYIKNSDGALSYEGSHPYSELPLSHIGPFNGTGENFNYAVTARGYESCSYQTSHGSPKCITSIVESELPEFKVKDLGYAWLIEANQSIRKYDLYNIQGLIMDSGSLNFNDLSIDKTHLSPGIYFLNLKFDESPARLKLVNY